jgi:hypothetical protein
LPSLLYIHQMENHPFLLAKVTLQVYAFPVGFSTVGIGNLVLANSYANGCSDKINRRTI